MDNLRFSVGLTGDLGGFDWDLRYTHSETDHYFYQPDTTTALEFEDAMRIGNSSRDGGMAWLEGTR